MKGRRHSEDLDVDWRIILNWLLDKEGGNLRTGFVLLSGGLLWTRKWTFRFHKRWRISRQAEWLL